MSNIWSIVVVLLRLSLINLTMINSISCVDWKNLNETLGQSVVHRSIRLFQFVWPFRLCWNRNIQNDSRILFQNQQNSIESVTTFVECVSILVALNSSKQRQNRSSSVAIRAEKFHTFANLNEKENVRRNEKNSIDELHRFRSNVVETAELNEKVRPETNSNRVKVLSNVDRAFSKSKTFEIDVEQTNDWSFTWNVFSR